jgi:ectoine hydroxylase-related dioxygenase (phytanoyl-CoA dioxygenase family)
MKEPDPIEGDLLRLGYALIEDVVAEGGEADPEAEFDRLVADSGSGSRRIPPADRLVQWLLHQQAARDLVAKAMGKPARPVRAIAFDKTRGSNWSVPWHQDRTIAVDRKDQRAEVRNWTVKSGVPHCEPPIELLEGMLTLRWHLDSVGPEDGCLRVLPESHRLGRLSSGSISSLLSRREPCDVPVPAGALLVMRPLLVHSSRKRTTDGRRRVLHVELATGDPPKPLDWAWA